MKRGEFMNRNLFKMPNDIFGGKLSAGEIKVLAALYSLRSKSIYRGQKYIKVNQATIARICGFSSARTEFHRLLPNFPYTAIFELLDAIMPITISWTHMYIPCRL